MVVFSSNLVKWYTNWRGNVKVWFWKGIYVLTHVRMYIAIPPKFVVAQVVGYTKRKGAIHIVCTINRNFTGESF